MPYEVCYVYGQRYVDYEYGPLYSRLHLWDFNPNVRRPSRTPAKPSKPPPLNRNEKSRKRLMSFGPYRDVSSSRREGGLDEDKPGVTPMNQYASLPFVETGISVFKDKDIFVHEKVESSLPFRRTTGRANLPQLAGVMLDDERIYMLEVRSSVIVALKSH